MPAHKNQHFVPRCALKPFSLNGEGKAINLFNIKGERLIQNAPVKGQCARDYLYSKEDLKAEKMLTMLEGYYARIVQQLSSDGALSRDDIEMLRMFILIQMRRTELAIEQLRGSHELMAEKTYIGAPEQKPTDHRTDRELMHTSLRFAVRMIPFAKDLKIAVFRNKTDIDFVTSDNPGLLTNRFHFQKLNTNKFGISNSGAILSMPLSPRMSVIFYDTGTYSMPNASGTPFIEITNSADVLALNQMQYLSAAKNIYFTRWTDGGLIKSELEALPKYEREWYLL
jgi:hypothetical protein